MYFVLICPYASLSPLTPNIQILVSSPLAKDIEDIQ